MQRAFLIALFTIVLSGCGYVGEPQYPALHIPNPVTDLAVIEHGDHLAVQFTIPALTTEGLAVKSIGAVELRVGAASGAGFNVDQWAQSATRVEVAVPELPGPVQASVPLDRMIGKEVILAVRVANNRGRNSQWSNLVTLQVEPPVATPVDLTAVNAPGGVQLHWTDDNAHQFRIFRRAEKETQPAQLATTDKSGYLDTTTTYGQTYEYFVQGVNDKAESDTAGPATVITKDTFAPAVPAGITASAGLNAIELEWTPNTEPDLRGYKVYRAIKNGPFELIAGPVEAPNYSDKMVQSGQRYRYAVTSIDQRGNESEKSATVEAVAP